MTPSERTRRPLTGEDEDAEAKFVVNIVDFGAGPPAESARSVFTARDMRFRHEYVGFAWVNEQGLHHIEDDATRRSRAPARRRGSASAEARGA